MRKGWLSVVSGRSCIEHCGCLCVSHVLNPSNTIESCHRFFLACRRRLNACFGWLAGPSYRPPCLGTTNVNPPQTQSELRAMYTRLAAGIEALLLCVMCVYAFMSSGLCSYAFMCCIFLLLFLLCRCPVLAWASVRPSIRLSVCLSIIPCCSIKTMQARTTKSLLSAPQKTLLAGSVKLF